MANLACHQTSSPASHRIARHDTWVLLSTKCATRLTLSFTLAHTLLTHASSCVILSLHTARKVE